MFETQYKSHTWNDDDSPGIGRQCMKCGIFEFEGHEEDCADLERRMKVLREDLMPLMKVEEHARGPYDD